MALKRYARHFPLMRCTRHRLKQYEQGESMFHFPGFRYVQPSPCQARFFHASSMTRSGPSLPDSIPRSIRSGTQVSSGHLPDRKLQLICPSKHHFQHALRKCFALWSSLAFRAWSYDHLRNPKDPVNKEDTAQRQAFVLESE